MVRFCDGPCPKCDHLNPDPSCPECHGSGMVGWCDESRVTLPRTETPWSRALAAALLQNRMTLDKARNATGIEIVRLSRLKNGEDQPTEEEREALEEAIGFSVLGMGGRIPEGRLMTVILPCLAAIVTAVVIRHYLAQRRRQEKLQWRNEWDQKN